MASRISALPLPEGTGAIVSLQTDGGTAGAVQMTTAEIEEAISYLAALRAELAPAVNRDPNAQHNYTMTEDAQVEVARTKFEGCVILSACDPGLGWLAFALKPERAMLVGAMLVKVADVELPDPSIKH